LGLEQKQKFDSGDMYSLWVGVRVELAKGLAFREMLHGQQVAKNGIPIHIRDVSLACRNVTGVYRGSS